VLQGIQQRPKNPRTVIDTHAKSLEKARKTGKLDLSRKSLTEIPPAVFELVGLKELRLGRNPELTNLPAALKKLTALKTLDVSDCGLTDLPPFLTEFVELQSLDVSGNRLSLLPSFLGALKTLRVLEFRENQIAQVPEVLFELGELRELRLEAGSVTELPEAVGKLKKLQVLDLQRNLLKSLPEVLWGFKNLTELFLANCSLRELPGQIARLRKLKTLSLSDNDLYTLPDELFTLPKLEQLYVRNNRLSELGPPIWKLPALKTIAANGNPLTSFPGGLAQAEELPKLKHVSLADCQLTNLDAGFLEHRSLEKLDLKGNPLLIPSQVIEMGDSYPFEINIAGFMEFMRALPPGHQALTGGPAGQEWNQRIPVSQTAYESESKYEPILETVQLVGSSLIAGNSLESIPKAYTEMFLVAEFRHQLADAGMARFLNHYGWGPYLRDRLLFGFLKIGAVKSWHYARQFAKFLDGLPEQELERLAETGQLSNPKLQKELSKLDTGIFRVLKLEDPTDCQVTWCWDNGVFQPTDDSELTERHLELSFPLAG
jgi:Leucine-rich repeat (LRR) protein